MADEHFDLITGKPLEPWAQQALDRRVATPVEGLTGGEQQKRRAALVERLGMVADLACQTPSPGDLGDVAYDLLREAAAQIASDRLRFERLAASPPTHATDAASPATAAGSVGEVDLTDGEWFYPEGDHSSDECRFSADEVIDYALEGNHKSQVVCIERAASLPAVYAAVRVYSDAEKDERQSDDGYDYTLFATAEEARAALHPATDTRDQGGEA